MLDMSLAQTAHVLGRNVNEVKMLQRRAHEVLRKRLTALGKAPKATERTKAQTRPKQAIVLRERRFALWP
jgi:hypothetical protein